MCGRNPINNGFGLAIVRVSRSHRSRPSASLDDVREQIRQRLLGVRSQERMAEYMSELRDGTRIEILDPRLEALPDTWAGDPGQ